LMAKGTNSQDEQSVPVGKYSYSTSYPLHNLITCAVEHVSA
jgi:hypothetical protein